MVELRGYDTIHGRYTVPSDHVLVSSEELDLMLLERIRSGFIEGYSVGFERGWQVATEESNSYDNT